MLDYIRDFFGRITRNDLIWLGLSIVFAVACVGLLFVGMAITGHEGRMFTGEPQIVLDGFWYVGAFSNFGGVVWFSAGAVLCFALIFRPKNLRTLAAAAALTWAMGIDDIFLLHDSIYPRFGIDQRLVYGTYFVLSFGLLLLALKALRPATAVGVALAMGCWGGSVIMDLFFNDVDQALEDGLKFVGVSVWAATWIAQCYYSITAKLVPSAISE